MKAYKGFNSKLQCTPTKDITFQYEVGKTYETDEVNLCHSGFHACKYPLDVFNYYPPAGSRFCEVELSGVDGKTDNDSKRTGKKIKIKAEIGLGLTVWFAVRLLLTAWLTWTSLLVCMHLAELERGYSGAVGGEILLAAVVGVLCWKLLGRRR